MTCHSKALRVEAVERGAHCTWCDRRAAGGERWLSDEDDWLYCSPLCYARVADGAVRENPNDSSVEFISAFQLGLLTLTVGRSRSTSGDA